MRTKLTLAAALVIMAAASLGIRNAMAKQGDAGSYGAGYKHGCDDAKLPVNDRYIVQAGKGAAFIPRVLTQDTEQGLTHAGDM